MSGYRRRDAFTTSATNAIVETSNKDPPDFSWLDAAVYVDSVTQNTRHQHRGEGEDKTILKRVFSVWSIRTARPIEGVVPLTGSVGASAQFGHRETIRTPKGANLTQIISKGWQQ